MRYEFWCQPWDEEGGVHCINMWCRDLQTSKRWVHVFWPGEGLLVAFNPDVLVEVAEYLMYKLREWDEGTAGKWR